MKNVKQILGVFVIMVCALLLVPNNVNATEVNSATTLAEVFKGKDATVNGKTVKLTGTVTIDELMFSDEDFVLDLNGHTLKVTNFYVSGGSLTINDATKKGVIDTTVIQVVEEGTLTVNQMILEASGENPADLSLEKETTAIINNGTIEHAIWNEGTLTIKNAKVSYISQNGTATIYDGEFTTLNVADLEENKTTLYGETFNNENEAVVITSSKQVNSDTIQELVPDGYLAVCGPADYGTEIGKWGSVSIIKDIRDEIFNKIAPNGVWNTNTLTPTNYGDAEFLLSAIANDFDLPKGYELSAYAKFEEPFDASKVNVVLNYNGLSVASKSVKATYTTPDEETLNTVNKIITEIDKSTEKKYDIEHSFKLDDLYLINYLNASSKGINKSMALNFAKDLIELTNGSNIVYKFGIRLGENNPIDLWEYIGGGVVVYYNGKAVNTTSAGITISKVLYVPTDTANTDEARINAAMKRIKEYLGTTDGISIKVGGTLESLNAEGMEWNEYDLFDETTSGNNYYIVTINGNEYKFVICKKANLETPKYIASDVISNIFIKSDDTSIPLDTALTVKEVKNNTIEKALGTSLYAAYDISLYSNAKQVNITKLENGKFIVSIPVPEILKDKEITVYYINSKGEKEEHTATVKDGIASFETDHFSTYVLAEKLEEENPKTFDGIGNSIIIGTLSLIGLVGTIIYLKKRSNIKVS